MISPEARAFIQNAILPQPRNLDRDAIQSVRDEYRAKFAPVGAELADAYLDRIEAIEIAGVQVQVCTPKRLDQSWESQAIFYLFGGGYVVGSPFEDLAIIAQLASYTGLKIFAPVYRLAPEHPFPAALDDASRVYASLAGTLGSEQVAVVGESAGGNLALTTLLRAKGEGLSMPAAVALMSPWTDLTGTSENRGLDPTFPADSNYNAEANAYAGGRDLTDPLISPIFATDWAAFPPTVITTGTRDRLMNDCAQISTVMRRAGVDVRLNLWEGMWHVFECYPEIPESEQSLREIADFITGRLTA